MRITTSLLAAALVAAASFSVAATQDHPSGGQDHPRGGEHPRGGRGAGAAAAAKGRAKVEIGAEAPAFALKGVDGKDYSLADCKGKVVVLEWICSTCPASGRGEGSYWGSGKAAATVKGVRAADPDALYFAVNSTKDGYNDASNKDEGAASAEVTTKAGAAVPVLLDADGAIGKAYGAKTTPHIFIIDGSGKVAYIGAPVSKDGATNYVVNAVKALKEGKAVEPSTTKNEGCGIKYAGK